VAQELSVFSIFSLVSAFLKMGAFHLRYWRWTTAGLWMASIFVRLGAAKSSAELLDIWVVDTEYSRLSEIHLRVAESCRGHMRTVRTFVDRYLPRQSETFRTICAANIIKDWDPPLFNLELLRNGVKLLAKEMGIPEEHVAILSPYVKLRRRITGTSDGGPMVMIHQPSLRMPFLFTILCFLIAVHDVFVVERKAVPVTPRRRGIGVTAAWGVAGGRLNDFFWWQQDRIPADRLLYLFDPVYCQPEPALLAEARRMGIESVVLDGPANASGSHLSMKGYRPFSERLRDVLLVCWILIHSVYIGGFGRRVLSQILKNHLRSARLAAVYRDLGLRVMFHNEEQGDIPSLAMERVDGIRAGFYWSSPEGPDTGGLRPHQVFFLWGAHDARVCMDAGSVSQHVLIAGCPMQEMCSNPASRKTVRNTVETIRGAGATCVLTLFDSSMLLRRFYRFFLQWLIDDSSLGIIVKPKYAPRWNELRKDGLSGLVAQALATQRLHVLPSDVSPADAAVATDFSVGACTPSAVTLAALASARILYLDYARIVDGPLKPYATLHRLGPDRCVFYDPVSLKRAVQGYREDPTSNPNLGDASPILHEFDPFRDGKAGVRMGEYISWYLEGLDAGFGRDQALSQATSRYADKWGAGTVLRGLPQIPVMKRVPIILGDQNISAQPHDIPAARTCS
jgi:hypothetical protein